MIVNDQMCAYADCFSARGRFGLRGVVVLSPLDSGEFHRGGGMLSLRPLSAKPGVPQRRRFTHESGSVADW